jgi:hypothetical protein
MKRESIFPDRPPERIAMMAEETYLAKTPRRLRHSASEERVITAVAKGGTGLDNLKKVVTQNHVHPFTIESLCGLTLAKGDRAVLLAHFQDLQRASLR